MYVRRAIARRTGSSAMQDVLEVLNFAKGQATSDGAEQADVERLHVWLVAVLGPLLTPRTCEEGLRTLAAELSEWAEQARIYPMWQVNQLSPKERAQGGADRQYRRGTKAFTVVQWYPLRPSSLEARIKMNVGTCLVSGELNRLRVCPVCEKFFYAGDIRKCYCSHACYKRQDKILAVARAKKWRADQRTQRQPPAAPEAALKAYARAVLVTLSLQQIRALRKAKVLDYTAGEKLDSLREQFKANVPFDHIWKDNPADNRALFTRLQQAGV